MFEIKIDKETRGFQPGEVIRGQIDCGGETNATSVEIRLLWTTSGKGTRDTMIVEELVKSVEPGTRRIAFELVAPRRPYSFSGKLVTLDWEIEATLLPSRNTSSVQVMIGPDAHEVRLQYAKDS